MLTPDGQSADKMDKIMLLSMWTKTLKQASLLSSLQASSSSGVGYISAGMGKPTYPVDLNTVAFQLEYWKQVEEMAKAAIDNLDIVGEGAAVDYGDPKGDVDARALMADAMSAWYGTEIMAENVLFTAGGAGAIRTIFDTLNERYKEIPGYRVITPFPHYSLYSDNPGHRLHPVEVMKAPGYRLTAEALEASIQSAFDEASKDMGTPKAVLICNPSNPLGTIIHEDEMVRLADVLRKYPDMHIVLDEAYAEMAYSPMPSILTVAPDLKERVIMMRSATKGLSAAGERMAVLMSFNAKMSNELLTKNISLMGHAPRSSQMAYARTMAVFSSEEKERRLNFYKKKVDYVSDRLKAMGASMPDPEYKAEATFYVLADLSDMFGQQLPEDSKRALGKEGVVSSDEDLAYYLLFKDKVMIAPLSYFGVDSKKGLMRITCSDGSVELKEMMDRIEHRLFEARLLRCQSLIEKIQSQLPKLELINPVLHRQVIQKITDISQEPKNCLSLKNDNQLLCSTLSEVNTLVRKSSAEERVKAATSIQSFFRSYLTRKGHAQEKQQLDSEWTKFIDEQFTEPCLIKTLMMNASESDRNKYLPWVEHLKTIKDGRNDSVMP